MNFRDSMAPKLAPDEGAALATKLRLRQYSLDAPGLSRLHRLKEIIDFHPSIVNQELSPEDQSYYY